jgi:molybdopterin converting factor small subunit
MSAKVTLHPFFCGVETHVEVEGSTVGDCIAEVLKTHPDWQGKMFAKAGKLKGYIEIYVNGSPTFPKELDYPVNDGDQVNVLVYLAGG